jgi:hypothetical protein
LPKTRGPTGCFHWSIDSITFLIATGTFINQFQTSSVLKRPWIETQFCTVLDYCCNFHFLYLKMSISNTADVPTLVGGLIDLAMITKETDESIRRTKIICTIGPACWEVPQLETLIDAGMNVGEHCFSFLFLCQY